VRSRVAAGILYAVAGLLLIEPSVGAQSIPPPDRTPPDPTAISGTLFVDGCVVAAGDLALSLAPTGVGGALARVSPAPTRDTPDEPEHPATLAPTDDPHVFTFVASDLVPGALYQLAISHPPNPCGRIFWRAPAQGLVQTGRTDVQLEGYAARTTLDVQDLRTSDWLGMDDLRFDNPLLATRRLRWRSTLDRVIGGELQVSYDPFPVGGPVDPCQVPDSGLLYRRRVAARSGEWSGKVDFGPILSPTGFVLGIAALPGRVSADQYASLLAGHPVYVRMIPLRTSGPACDVRADGVNGWVILARVPHRGTVSTLPPTREPPTAPLSSTGNQLYLPPRFDPSRAPGYFDLGYKVVKEHQLPTIFECTWVLNGQIPPAQTTDPLGCQIVTQHILPEGAVLKPGPDSWFTITLHWSSGGGGLSIGDFVTGFLNAAGYAVDALHNLTEEVKAAVAKVVVDVIKALPVAPNPCDSYPDTCQQVVTTGLEIGLTAMGLPPTIPNWEQLKQQGVDYLASEIASQTDVPPVLVDHAFDAAESAIADMTAHLGDGAAFGYDWVVPYDGFDPAVRIVSIEKHADISPFISLIRANSSLFDGGALNVPPKFPAAGALTVPMVLEPNLSGIPAPVCVSDKLTKTITCTPSLSPGPLCYSKSYDFDHPNGKLVEADCSQVGWPRIYYRDHWVGDKLYAGACTNVFEHSVFDFFGAKFSAPAPPYLDGAIFDPTQFQFWHGPFYAQPACQ
jgi:hypothetical protein